MRKRLFVLLALMLIAVMAFGVSAQESGVLRIPMGAEPEHLDPFRSTTTATRSVIGNIYEALVTLNPNGPGVTAELAESWDVSEDGLVYTFNLRPGVMFQDVEGVEYENREVTAEDWVWSMQTFLSADTEVSEHPEYLSSVLGGPEFTAGEAETVEGINVVDDHTLEITLAAPNFRFLYDLINVYVVPQEAFEQLEDFSNRPVGTGPFLFGEWLRDDHLTLLANPEYWEEGKPLLDEVRFINVPDENTGLLLYRENELDLLYSFPPGQFNSLKAEFAAEYQEQPGLNVRYYGFKMDEGGFLADNPLVRQAINHAIDRDTIWNILMEGQRIPGTMGVLPPSMPASDVEGYEYNPDRARELLAEAGFPNGEGLPPITLYILGSLSSTPDHAAFQAQLAEVGINVELVVEDNATYWDHIDEDPEVEFFLSGWSSDFADPSEVFNFLFLDADDSTHYDDEEVGAMIREAQTITDADERNALYQQIHERIMEQAAWVPSSYSIISFLQKPWVEGFTVTPSGTYTAELKNVSIAG